MSPDQRSEVGRRGERAAARYLEQNGCRIVERNYRTREGEIDLIVISGRTLVFCEVKTLVARSGNRRGVSGTGRGVSGTGRGVSGTGRGPAYLLEGIGTAKRRQVRRIARSWLAERLSAQQGLRFRDIRFDAIGVLLSPSGKALRLERVEAAF